MESFTMWSPLSLSNDESLPIIMVEGRLLPTVLGAALSTLCRMSFSILDSSSPSPNTIPAPFPSHSCVTHCPELDLSVSLSPAPNPDHMQQKTCRLKQSQHSDEPQQRPHPRRQTERKRNTKVCFEEPEAVRVTPDRRIVPHQHHLRGQRGSSKYCHVGRCSMEPPAAGLVWNPGCLDNAELNSTLALKEMEFNSKKALQQTLLKSRRTKTLIDARAIEVVNVSPSQHLFNSLVSVSVQEDELLSQVLQAKLILAPLPSHYYKSAESPSLNFFITSELFRKKPLQQEEEPAKCKPSPMACPAYSTFDLYRRQRCWEAIP
ncbi:protein phosphatase 1 regulatory subunit 35 isoform X2 [Xiphophorus couchianus]|uniref:protein phosphatase 1 regulatory subunit 35 isoform X2 n=1 Tax=Xiphophorus couchianus TaxID=32473 RepID=UPI001016958C|nr:uncharacterized protein LOC114152792 isoform X2 [Xiphophorus couchianus]